MMTNAQLAAASFDDIIFDGRNKGYGAYQLRGLYQRHVSRALAIATTIFALLVFSPILANYLKDTTLVVITKPPIPVGPINPPPLDERKEEVLPPPPAVAPPPPPVPQIRFTPPVVAKETEVTEEIPDAKVLEGQKVGPETIIGPSMPATLEPVELAEAPNETAGIVEEKPFLTAEQMPELPGGGGVAAIVAAIQKAVKYPSRAISAGVEGKVYVRFVVNKQGEVVDIEVVKGLGAGLDEETIRAIRTLPRFIPGKQNGREVSVSYSVPITFKIQ
ncbi:energy transducer TonB [uncultured Hymenobacter sp.]|uniref:energy transducer TonB n=1 Tax=uncultured Hymenobacter sp. TaxID=170016 RepID=UPI0035CA9468